MPHHVAVSRHINLALLQSFILAFVLLQVGAAQAQPVLGLAPNCTTADLSGAYRYSISGFYVSSVILPYSDSGLLYADGNGNITGKSSYVLGGSPITRSFSGSYSMRSTCTGTVTFSDTAGNTIHVEMALTDGGEQVNFIEIDGGSNVAGKAQKQHGACSQTNLFGSYSYALTGWLETSNAVLPFSALGVVSVDVSGNYTGADIASTNGSLVHRTVSGTFNIAPDCSGSATFNDSWGNSNDSLGNSLHLFLVSASDGHDVAFVETDNGTNLAGTLVRQLAGPSFGIVDTTTRAVGPISPGKLVSIVGQNLVSGTFLSLPEANGAVPNGVGGAQVLMNGVPASIIFAEPEEICVLVPFSIAGASSVTVQVKNQLGASNTQTVPLLDAAPTIFSLGSGGVGQGFVVNNSGVLNSIYHPFPVGTAISIWGTGGGVTSPVISDGQILNIPLFLANSVSVQIGGVNAQVLYAGFGGNPPVMQINAVIPSGVTPGTAVPIDVTVGGQVSQPGLTMAVQ